MGGCNRSRLRGRPCKTVGELRRVRVALGLQHSAARRVQLLRLKDSVTDTGYAPGSTIGNGVAARPADIRTPAGQSVTARDVGSELNIAIADDFRSAPSAPPVSASKCSAGKTGLRMCDAISKERASVFRKKSPFQNQKNQHRPVAAPPPSGGHSAHRNRPRVRVSRRAVVHCRKLVGIVLAPPQIDRVNGFACENAQRSTYLPV